MILVSQHFGKQNHRELTQSIGQFEWDKPIKSNSFMPFKASAQK